MVSPIQPVSGLGSPIIIEFPMSQKRIQQIIKKIFDEEKNQKKRSRKEIEESWERFRRKPKKEENAEL